MSEYAAYNFGICTGINEANCGEYAVPYSKNDRGSGPFEANKKKNGCPIAGEGSVTIV